MIADLVKEKPHDPDVQVVAARLALAQGNPEEATRHAREAVKAGATSAAAHYTLGLTAMARGDRSEAERELTRVVEINPRAAAARRCARRRACENAICVLAGVRGWGRFRVSSVDQCTQRI